MSAPDRVPLSFARGLRSVEHMPGGALLYHVVFGGPGKRQSMKLLTFNDLDAEQSDKVRWQVWVGVVAFHLVLLGAPILTRAPQPDTEKAQQEGMTVDLVAEPSGPSRPSQALSTHKDKVGASGAARIAPETIGASPIGPVPQSEPSQVVADSPAVASAPSLGTNAVAAPAVSAANVAAPVSANVRVIAPEETRWEGAILDRITRKKRYPSGALHDGLEGTAMLRLLLDRDGGLLHAEIARSAGHGPLDREVLALARRSSPYPRPPASVAGDTISLIVPVEFVIRKR